jgi:hypothetical protein
MLRRAMLEDVFQCNGIAARTSLQLLAAEGDRRMIIAPAYLGAVGADTVTLVLAQFYAVYHDSRNIGEW